MRGMEMYVGLFMCVLLSQFQTTLSLEWTEPEKICVGSKGDSPGYWRLPSDGVLRAVKLKHDGQSFITCNKNGGEKFNSKWGCGAPNLVNLVNIHITDNFNNNIFPTNHRQPGGFYPLIGRNHMSESLGFSALYSEDVLEVKRGDEVRVWYGEDLFNHAESDNDGMTCMMASAYIARK